MKLSTDHILTTHVGSLPRPRALVDMLLTRDRGEPYDSAAMTRLISEATNDVVARQVKIGVDVVSDGETGKVGYGTYIKERLAGFSDENFSPRVMRDMTDYPELLSRMMTFTGRPAFKRLCCTGPIKVIDDKAVKTDIANLTAALRKTPARDAFMNAASPGVVANFQPNRYYKKTEDYFAAISKAMQGEYEAIVAAGIVLQIDSPDLAMSRHTAFQDLTEAEFLRQAEQQVEALNAALVNIPASSVRLHICWGNYEGPHDFDLPVEKILPVLMKAKVQGYVFEAANPRHAHEWKAWRDAKLPDDKVLIPGMIDTSTNFIEHPELVAQRIELFTPIVGRERVIAGTDCGFATFVGAGKIDPDIAFRKLEALVQGAEIATRRLWH